MQASEVAGLSPPPVGAPPTVPKTPVPFSTEVAALTNHALDQARARSPRPVRAVAEDEMPAELLRLSQQVDDLQKELAATRVAYEGEKRAKEEAERQLKEAREFFAVPNKQRAIREESNKLKEDIFSSVKNGIVRMLTGGAIDSSKVANQYGDALRDLTVRNTVATQQLERQRETVAKLGSENESTANAVQYSENWLEFFRKLNYLSVAIPAFLSKVQTLGKALEDTKKNLSVDTLRTQMQRFKEVRQLKEELIKKGNSAVVEASPKKVEADSDLLYLIKTLHRLSRLHRESEEKILGPLPKEGDKFFTDCCVLMVKLCKEWKPAYEQYHHILLQLNHLEDQLLISQPLEKLAKEHDELYDSISKAINQFNSHLKAPHNGRNPVSGATCQADLAKFYRECEPKLRALEAELKRLEHPYQSKITKYGKEKSTLDLCTYSPEDAHAYNIDPNRSLDLIKTDLYLFNEKLRTQVIAQEELLMSSWQKAHVRSFDYTALILSWIEPIANGHSQQMTTWIRHWTFGGPPRKPEQPPAPAPEGVEPFVGQDTQ